MVTSSNLEHTLKAMWDSGQFEPHIHHIRFPEGFRNLSPGLRINFQYPITAIVGQNGTNKSSILRAIQGSPDYENIGRYWFGTAIDIIPPGERQAFIHGRHSRSAGKVVETLKTRIRRAHPVSRASSGVTDPDYFEPSRPIQRYGMEMMEKVTGEMPPDRTLTRWKAIEKEVVYLDFRAEISAFDKYFYHHDFRRRPGQRTRNRRASDDLGLRKDFIRDRSERLKTMIEERHKSYRPGGKEWVVVPLRRLSSNDTKAVSRILGRDYSSIEVITHRAFDVVGTTARLKTADFSYSEAWAGSGEFAAIQLVSAVSDAKKKSLLLLDEPEVSLHPGAQRRLLAFLQNQAKEKLLQVVIATHSPVLLEGLPECAIKVLEIAPGDPHVVLRSQSSLPGEAFVALEHNFARQTIVVEDELAKQIVLKALRGAGSVLHTVDVKVYPGGASSLLTRYLPTWANTDQDVLVYLDGDQRIAPPIPEPSSVAPSELASEIKRLCKVDARDVVPANTGGATDPQLRKFLSWCHDHVRFLPGDQPEQWLRDKLGVSSNIPAKQWWVSETERALGKVIGETVSSTEIADYQKLKLVDLQSSDVDLETIRVEIKNFLGTSQ